MKKFGFYFIMVLMVLVITESLFTLLFYIKDESGGGLIHLSSVKDEPYTYYGYESNDENNRNSDGFITTIAKNKTDKYRVAIIGGSVAQGLGAFTVNEVPCLESELQKVLGSANIEVLNAGLAGYVTEQEFIMLQLKLLDYKPDLVFGLDGYNDLVSYKLNRNHSKSMMLPPQNYRDFQVIEDGKFKKEFSYRFLALFKNTHRVYRFFRNYVKGINNYDLSNVSNEEIEKVATCYQKIIMDTHDFCQIRGVKYYSILQPIRYYNTGKPDYKQFEEADDKLTALYHAFEQKTLELDYGISVADIFEEQVSVYTDDCHVTAEGNTLFSVKLAQILAPIIESDSTYLRLHDRAVEE